MKFTPDLSRKRPWNYGLRRQPAEAVHAALMDYSKISSLWAL